MTVGVLATCVTMVGYLPVQTDTIQVIVFLSTIIFIDIKAGDNTMLRNSLGCYFYFAQKLLISCIQACFCVVNIVRHIFFFTVKIV